MFTLMIPLSLHCTVVGDSLDDLDGFDELERLCERQAEEDVQRKLEEEMVRQQPQVVEQGPNNNGE